MPTDTAPSFSAWLFDHQAEDASGDALAVLVADLLRRGRRRLPKSPEALSRHLRNVGASPAVHAAAASASVQYRDAVRAAEAEELAR